MKLGATQQFASPMEALAHISETPWSEFKKSDYTLEQWHRACLIHTHEGEPTSKSECKLPVKTPDGVLNRNGVHAAAAALAGARGGLKGVSDDQKKKAGNALKRYYTELDEEAPESLSQADILDAMAHFGVKGMKWGVRKERAANLNPLIAPGKPIERITASGEKFTLTQNPPTKIHKALAFASANYTAKYGETAYLTIKDSDGKKIGSANFWNKDKDTVYLNMIEVKPSARGRGFATAILKSAEEHSRAAGKKKMLLEVPGIAPDARHIYEKLGFRVTHEPTEKERKTDPMWGGLTHMEKSLLDD